MPLLRVRDLVKTYQVGDAAVRALRGVTLDIDAGEFVAVVGPSGSGKSTFMHILGCLDRPTSGEYWLEDRDVSRLNDDDLSTIRNGQIGFVFQGFNLLARTSAVENVELPLLYGAAKVAAGERRRRALAALEAVGLADRAAHHPNQLSGGQQQRTALARALAPRPGLILLDEPFNALDADLRRSVCEEVVATLRASGTTAILVTHDPQEAFASADLVAVMHDGAIAQSGDPTSLYRTPNHAQVARLTGPAIFLAGRIDGTTAQTVLGPIALRVVPRDVGSSATIFLRPEQIVLAAPGEGVPARIEKRMFRGDHFLATVRVGDIALQVRLTDASVPAATDTVSLRVMGSGLAFAEKDPSP
jgi:ABC-type Fe3+/spermidine/putrescine transport system ATPase subunit